MKAGISSKVNIGGKSSAHYHEGANESEYQGSRAYSNERKLSQAATKKSTGLGGQ